MVSGDQRKICLDTCAGLAISCTASHLSDHTGCMQTYTYTSCAITLSHSEYDS